MLFSHPTGNANVRAALVGLFEANLLKEFHTTVASYPGNLWDLLGNSRFGAQFQRRQYDERLQFLTVQHPFRELGRMLTNRLKVNWFGRNEQGPFCVDAIYRELDEMGAKRLRESPAAFTGVYTFEDGALESLTVAQDHGLTGIYDLPIGYWRTYRKLLEKELERTPEWAGTLTGFKDSPEKLDRKDLELAKAKKIIVASSFTAHTLKDYSGSISNPVIVPYGFPPISPDTARPKRGPINKTNPLRLLFVGGLSQRKGIADLFAAVSELGTIVSLTMIGAKVTADCEVLDKELSRHRWIPSLPHEEILNEMRMHDVLVFPSLFEGFGLVISEAMSQGTPVITTERTAGPDLITNGKNGWIIKAGLKDELVRQLEELVRSPDAVQEAGFLARQKAATRPWSIYGRELAAAITKDS
jgi:glycosyltransferase involved in cell wall biosynthesis